MIDDADDLFAPRPAPTRVKVRKTPPVVHNPAPSVHKLAVPCITEPAIVSFGCRCGARDEVKAPCPAALDCWHCGGLETMIAYVPRYPPPHTAGRSLTEIEREGMRLDSHR